MLLNYLRRCLMNDWFTIAELQELIFLVKYDDLGRRIPRGVDKVKLKLKLEKLLQLKLNKEESK